MKKILLLLFLFCSVAAFPQVAVMGGGVPEGAAPSYTTEYQALLDVWTTDPTGDTLTWQNAFCDSMDTNGYWDRADFMFWFAHTDNGDGEALVDWIHPDSSATAVNSPSWLPLRGYTGNGTSSYINTNRNLTSEADNYSQNDAAVGAYIRDNSQNAGAAIGRNNTNVLQLTPRFTDNSTYIRINATGSTAASGVLDSRGFWIGTRTGAALSEIYLDATALADGNTDRASTGVPNLDILTHTRDLSNFSTNEIAFVIVMDGVSQAEVTKINSFVETLMDHYGMGVQ